MVASLLLVIRDALLTLVIAVILVAGLMAIPQATDREMGAWCRERESAWVPQLNRCRSDLQATTDTTRAEDADSRPSWMGRTIASLEQVATNRQWVASTRDPTGRVFFDTPRRTARSLGMVLVATGLVLLLAVPIGIASGLNPGTPAVRVVRRALSIISGVPIIVWGTILLVAALQVWEKDFVTASIVAAAWVLAFGDRLMADMIDRVELATQELLEEPHIRTVRAAGFGIKRHLAQGLVPGVADAIAARALHLVSGGLVLEVLFKVEGIGIRVYQAVDPSIEHDRVAVIACTVGLASIGILLRAAAQTSAALADGRRRGR